MKTRRAFGLSIFLFIFISSLNYPAAYGAQAPRSPIEDSDFGACLAKNNKLAVLMLIDESKSLREFKDGSSTKAGNDPFDSRVPALESVIQVLLSAVETSQLNQQAESRKIEVSIGISGFGDAYNERVPFQSLNSKTVDSVVSELNRQGDKDSDMHTRYHKALGGALQSFEEYSPSPEVCRLLVWFSDGEHDDDNLPGFVSRERDQIQEQMCGKGGIVDQLRQARVNIVAAGLNSDEKKLGLMRLIAEGGSAYNSIDASGKSGRVSVIVGECGGTQPTGKYALATSADEIIDKLFEVLRQLPGVPDTKTTVEIPASTVACSTPSDECNAFEFQVDESIASFQILAERPSSAVEVVLTTGEGETYPILKAGDATDEPIRRNVVKTTPVTKRKVFVSVTRKKENPIDGTWRLEFVGNGAKQSRGAVNFVGFADITLLDAVGQKVLNELKVARFKAEDLGIRVTNKTSGSTIRALKLNFKILNVIEEVESQRDEQDQGLFKVVGKELERALQSSNLEKLSSMDLTVQPIGDVQGLRFSSGSPVPINFGRQIFSVRVSNGAGLPSFVRAEGQLRFEGTPKKSIQLIFVGPDSGEGLIEFKEAIEADGVKSDFELISREPCVIPQQTEASCSVELIPDQEAYDQFQIAISVTYSGKDNLQKPVDGEIVLDVTMLKQPKASRGVFAAALLVLIFLTVQGLVRLFLAFLVSRFAPLVPIARRVRLDAVVETSGSISVNPMNLNPSHSDEGFALENTESVSSFSVFGYDFGVSVLRTFLHSTVAPLGQVTSPGTFVIGSRGYLRSKEQTEGSTGQVSLTLRGQWIVGIKAEDIQRLTNGGSSVAAEVVAFLEPYEEGVGIDRGKQISDLSFALVSSNFAAQLTEVLESERGRQIANVDDEPTDVTVVQAADDPFGDATGKSANDPFLSGTSESVSSEANKSSKRGGRLRRRDKQEQSSAETLPESSSASDNWDPFA